PKVAPGGSGPPPPSPRSVPPPPPVQRQGGGSLKPSSPTAPPLPTAPSRKPPPLPKPDAATPLKAPAVPHVPEPPRGSPEGSALVDLLTARVERLSDAEDRIGLSRAHIELAIVHETLADDSKVSVEIEAALKVDPDLAPAHAALRRRLHHRSQLKTML